MMHGPTCSAPDERGVHRFARGSAGALLLSSAVFGSMLLGACVTEDPRPEPGLYRRSDALMGGGSGAAGTIGVGSGGALNRPIDPDNTSQSRVTFAVEPLGEVPFDGMVLPLIAPDGRHMVVQQGRSPTWDAVLGEPDATPPMGTRLAIYEILPAAAGGRDKLRRLDDPSANLPAGLLLGRSADARGFLVECPRPDGSRWIGYAAFLTGEVTWLVQGEAVAAHAAFGASSNGGDSPSLVYSVQEAADQPRQVVLRRDLSDPATEVRFEASGESLVYPAITPDGSTLYAAALAGDGLWLRTFPLDSVANLANNDASRAAVGGARWPISPAATLMGAYQALVAAPQPGGESGHAAGSTAFASSPASRLIWFLPGPKVGMVGLDPLTGSSVSAGPSTYAVEWAGGAEPSARGDPAGTYLCAQPDGVWFRALSLRDAAAAAPPASLAKQGVQAMPGEFVPRRISDPARPFLLLGSSERGARDRLQVLGFGPVPQ